MSDNKAPPFPTHAFGVIAAAIERMAECCQVAPEMVGALVLGTISAVAQPLANVSEKPSDEGCPSSLNILLVAGTGERKSTVLSAVTRPLRKAIRNGANNRGLMILDDVTVDGLTLALIQVCPSCVLIAPEAAMLFGGYAMNKDNLTRFLGLSSALFSGEAFRRTRAKEHINVEDRRLNLILLSQPIVALEFLSNSLVMQQGFGNRFLYCAPSSLVGSRKFTDIDLTHDQDYLNYSAKITALAFELWPIDPDTGGVAPRTVRMTPVAKAAWVELHDTLETEAGPEGEYAEHVGYTIRFAEQVKRIAVLLALIEDPKAMLISEDVMNRAIELGSYFFDVALQLFRTGSANKDEIEAKVLLDWMTKKQRSENLKAVPVRMIYRAGPYCARPSKRARLLLEILESRGEVVQFNEGVTYEGGRKRSGQNYKVVNP